MPVKVGFSKRLDELEFLKHGLVGNWAEGKAPYRPEHEAIHSPDPCAGWAGPRHAEGREEPKEDNMTLRPSSFRKKTLELQLSSRPKESGAFSGYAALYEEVDWENEMFKRGAFAESLRARSTVPLLFNHDVLEPIGIADCFEDAAGLGVEGFINMDTQRGQELAALMRQSAVRGLAIGYQIIADEVDRASGMRIIWKSKLWEISIVVFPAQPRAVAAPADEEESAVADQKILEQLEALSLSVRILSLKARALALQEQLRHEEV